MQKAIINGSNRFIIGDPPDRQNLHLAFVLQHRKGWFVTQCQTHSGKVTQWQTRNPCHLTTKAIHHEPID